MPLINSWEVIKYVKASANRSGVNVVFEDVNKPRHDGSTIYLPRITADTTKKQLDDMMASCDHEIAHDLHSSFKVLQEIGTDASKSLVGFVFNMIEDDRVNSIEADQYAGFKQLWDISASTRITDVIEKLNVNADKIDTRKFINTCLYWHYKHNEERFPLSAESVNKVKYDKDMYDKISKHTDELKHCRTIINKEIGTKATYDLAVKLLKSCGFKVEPPEKEEEQEQLEELLKTVKEIVDSIHDKLYTEKGRDEEGKTPSGIAKSDLSTGVWGVNSNPEVKNFLKEGTLSPMAEYLTYFSKATSDSTTNEGFSQQVRRLIQIRSRSRYEYGVKKGKLDSARLSRICMSDAVGFNERVFKRKIISNVLDASISLLVDTSGSMAGDRYVHAVKSALLLNEAIGTALNIPVEIVGFTDSYSTASPICMIVHKDFNTKRNEEELINSFFTAAHYMHGNPDGECILWAYDRLKARKEKKKILIVFSDGAPAASRPQSGIFTFTKQVIGEIEKEKIVDIYGIGIEDESVKKLYTHQCTIKNSSQISTSLLKVIEEKLLNN